MFADIPPMLYPLAFAERHMILGARLRGSRSFGRVDKHFGVRYYSEVLILQWFESESELGDGQQRE